MNEYINYTFITQTFFAQNINCRLSKRYRFIIDRYWFRDIYFKIRATSKVGITFSKSCSSNSVKLAHLQLASVWFTSSELCSRAKFKSEFTCYYLLSKHIRLITLMIFRRYQKTHIPILASGDKPRASIW